MKKTPSSSTTNRGERSVNEDKKPSRNNGHVIGEVRYKGGFDVVNSMTAPGKPRQGGGGGSGSGSGGQNKK